jgi:hypothetical protein
MARTRLRRLAAVLVVAALSASGASAQQEQPGTSEQRRPGWTFVPSLAFGGAWDDNPILVGSESQELLPDEYVTALTPSASLNYLGRRLQLSTSYTGSFVFYRELTELNSLDQSGSFNVAYRATRTVTLSAAQNLAKSNETDPFEFVGVPFRRIANRRATTRGGVEVRLSPRTVVNGQYNFSVVDFDATDIVFPGGHEHAFQGDINHQLSSRLSLGATYGLRRMLVVNDPDPITLNHGAGTAEYRVNDIVTIDGSLGMSRVVTNNTDPILPEASAALVDLSGTQTGLAGRAGINVRQKHFSTSVYYERSMLPAFGFGGTFHNEELVGTVQGAFARNRAYWQASAAWRDNDPLETDIRSVLAPSRRATVLASRIGYRLSPWLNLEGYITKADQNAQRPGGLISRTRFGFQVVTSKPLRIAR